MRAFAFPALLLTGCVFPAYVATKTVEMTIPAADLRTLSCTSHNGDVTVTGDPAATAVAVRAEMSVRGHSQIEADANLHLLSLGKDLAAGTLKLYGRYDASELRNFSPCFTFTLTVPQQVALELSSHNGDIRTTGTTGALACESHNGDITGAATTAQVKAETHNGLVRLELRNEGRLDGTITSHNGDVIVGLGDGVGTTIDASTHNGSITPPAVLRDATIRKRSLRCRIGDGAGRLSITTHNGDVSLR